jgi:hypothetical protein
MVVVAKPQPTESTMTNDRIALAKLIEKRPGADFLLRHSRLLPAKSEPADEHAHGAPAHMSWACLLERGYDTNLESCWLYSGEFRIIAAIVDSAVIAKISMHLGLLVRAPPRTPARPLALFPAV